MVPKLKLLFSKAGWSAQPYSTNFGIYQNVLLHSEALSNSEVVEERALLDLHREVDDGHVGAVERVQHVRLAEVESLELKTESDCNWALNYFYS